MTLPVTEVIFGPRLQPASTTSMSNDGTNLGLKRNRILRQLRNIFVVGSCAERFVSGKVDAVGNRVDASINICELCQSGMEASHGEIVEISGVASSADVWAH